jgi:UDP-2,3-diacylglucosamine pyrophosphatase LpxH
MRFQLLSDLHLEFAPLELPGGDNLLLSGDITVADYLRPSRTDKDHKKMTARCKEFFFEQCAKYRKVYYIMGNHEHYQGIWNNSADILGNFLVGSNVTFLEKESLWLEDNIALWGGTLWTDMNKNHPMNVYAAKRGMNDYHVIQRDGGISDKTGNHNYYALNPLETMEDHANALVNLTSFLKDNADRKVIVMSHMAPSPRSRHPRYDVNDPLNWAYYSELSEFILNNEQIKVWVHGHTHDSHDYMIGNTRVLCNPRGYAHPQRKNEQENALFNINFTFEV